MCLAVPGKIIAIATSDDIAAPRTARVDFQGSQVVANLVFTPEAEPGDWVLVHAGFAIQCLDEEEARITWSYLQAEDLDELQAEALDSLQAEALDSRQAANAPVKGVDGMQASGAEAERDGEVDHGR